MKTLITAFFISMAAYSGAAMAGHDDRGGYYSAPHEWARYYADTAIRQVWQNRRQHCRYYGQRWSADYYDHYNWALRVSRGHAQSEINRRDRDLRHCVSHHGGYYGYEGYDYRYYGHDHRKPWRYRGKHGHGRHHDRRDRHDDGRNDRHRGHDRRHDDGHDSRRDRRDRRGDRGGG